MDELQKKKLFEKRNKELQQDLVVLETRVKEKLKPVVKLSQKIAEENRKTLKPLIDDLEKSMKAHYSAVKALFGSEDFIEGPVAFAEKRLPNWKGK